MDHIIHNLWLGSQEDADRLVRKNPEGITAILNVRGPDAYRPPGRDQSGDHPGKAYKWIPSPDNGRLSAANVNEAVAWLREQTAANAHILIHCKHGISRSAGFLAAFMVRTGIASDWEEAKATISARRPVLPAVLFEEHAKQAVLLSELTGLPNLQAFNRATPSPYVAIVDVDLMQRFNKSYGEIAGDALLRRLGKILISVGLDAYYSQGDEFLCRGDSREALHTKLLRARQLSREPFQIYAEGRIQTIEEADFSFGIGSAPEELTAALSQARDAKPKDDPPEWLRRIIAISGHDPGW